MSNEIEIKLNINCQHYWDLSEPEVLICKKCGYQEYVGDDGFGDYDDDGDDWCGDCGECEDCWDSKMQECGKLSSGLCTKAGSEECDWECPFSDE